MTVFITGPGRSGTTFLVQLFTRLGFDTGYEPYKEAYHDEIRAGCEVGPESDIIEDETPEGIKRAFAEAPRIIKGPAWAYLLKYFHLHDLVEIEHVFMPLRDLTASTKSRMDAGLGFLTDKVDIPGLSEMERQENALALLVGKVLEACYVHEIPLTLMRFPRLVIDEDYCFRKVTELEPIDRRRFREEFRELADPSKIKWSAGTNQREVRHPA